MTKRQRRDTHERGSAVIEVLVIGVVACVAMTQLLIGATRLEAAREDVAAAAGRAAEWSARYGTPRDAAAIAQALLPDATVEVTQRGSTITVDVWASVELLGPLGPRVEVGATRTAEEPPLRSRR